VLQAAPFNLDWGYDIYATVSASNVIGTSLTSVEGNGAKITTNPDKPLNLVNKPEITNSQNIGLSWTKGAKNGGTAVIDY
jgi:hypothetical protein